MDQAASAYQEVLRHVRECGKVAKMWRPRAMCLDRRFGLCHGRHRQEAPRPGRLAVHFATDILTYFFREDALAASVSG